MTQRTEIAAWDWHFRVGFDKSLADSVRDAIGALPRFEQHECAMAQLRVFSTFVSLDALIDAIGEQPHRASELIGNVREDALLFVPGGLHDHLEDKIGRLSLPVGQEEARRVAELFAYAKIKDFSNLHRAIFTPVFGSAGLERLLHAADQFSDVSVTPTDSLIQQQQLEETVRNCINDLLDDEHVQRVMGGVQLPIFDTAIENGYGFAEYWPSVLTGCAKDRLVVFDNIEQLRLGTLATTLAHEVLGHGTFYTAQSNCNPQFIDQGAMCLVEGWATWAEWHASVGGFGGWARRDRLKGMRWFDSSAAGEIATNLPDLVRSQGYSDESALSALLYFFQYPGYGASYTLGALWFEMYFKEKTPAEFLQAMARQPWGDFFLLWSD